MDKIAPNRQQALAINHDLGPALVVAGAGTGKTMIITQRIARLIEQGKALPREVLALTFTDKAAYEMEQRIDMLLMGKGIIDVAVMTFNAFGDRLIAEHGVDIGLGQASRLITRTQQLVLLRDHLDELELDYFKSYSNPSAQLDAILDHISTLQSHLITPTMYAEFTQRAVKLAKTEEAKLEALKYAEIARVYRVYAKLKRVAGVIDYDDQVSLAAELLSGRPNIRKQVRSMYKFILVDEFQDTNPAQARLLREVCDDNSNLMAVGDDDQSIYQFRGATVDNILNFPKDYPSNKQVVLTKNYRSAQSILDAAYLMIQYNNPKRLEFKYKFHKQLKSASSQSGEIQCQSFGNVDLEADAVASKIASAIASGVLPGDVAVLVRKRAQWDKLLPALHRHSVPYRVNDDKKLHLQPEIRFMLNYLQYIVQPDDSSALFHLLEDKVFELDLERLAIASGRARRTNQNLEAVLKSDPSGNDEFNLRVEQFFVQSQSLRQTISNVGVSASAWHILEGSGLLGRLEDLAERDPSVQIQFENLNRWFESLRQYEQIAKDISAYAYLRSIGELESLDTLAAYAEPELGPDEVAVLTIHQAKGLEFEQIYLFDVTQDSIPGRDLNRGIGLPDGLINTEQIEGDHLREERRLMYVAMTRAMHLLHISWSKNHGGKRDKKPSQFISEALSQEAVSGTQSTALDQAESIGLVRFAPSEKIRRIAEQKLIHNGILHLTPHQIDDYISCPLNFRYRYILEVPEAPNPAPMFGNLMHEVINRYFHLKKRGKVSRLELFEIVPRLWDPSGFPTRSLERKRHKEAFECIDKFYKREEAHSRLPAHTELPINVQLPDAKLEISGRVDAVYEDAAGVEIRDFKTGASADNPTKALKRAKTSIQLGLYALCWKEITGNAPTNLVLDFIETGETGEIQLSEKQIDVLRQKVIEAGNGIRAGHFPPKGMHEYCQHRHALSVDEEGARDEG